MADTTVALDPQLQARLENLEKQLFQIASKNHRTMYRQTEEAAPLAKLEATIRLLDSEFQQFRGTDPKRLVDALVTQYHANFRQEIEERLATRASEEELLQFQKDIFRIENFTRETQVNVFSLKSKLESLGADLESRFTEQRWSALEASLQKAASKQQEELQKEIRSQTNQQEQQVETKLKSVQGLLTLLEKEVKTQYGPEMLQEHMQTLEKSLAATVRSSLTDATQQLTAKVSNYEGQTQALRQLVLEAVADMKQELQGAALQARFQAYENRLAEQEERYKTLGQHYTALEAHLKRQTTAAQERQSDLYQELEQTQVHIKELDAKATQAQQQVTATCAKWLKEREQSFDTRYSQTEAALSILQDRAFALEEELGIALEQRKRYEETWKDQQAALQKSLEEKFTAWTDDKTVYLTGRVVDLTQQLQSTITLTKLHQRRVDELLAEENIRGFVSAIETKLRTSQEEWAQRRNADFSLKFSGFTKQYEDQKKDLEMYKESIHQEKETLLRKIRNIYKEEVDTSVLQFNTKVSARIATLQSEIQSEIQKFETAKAEIQTLQTQYAQQTNTAMVIERYSEFQEALKKEVRATFTANQTALNTKYAETMDGIQAMLRMVKDQEVRIDTLFSEKAFQEHLRTLEARVLKASEDWRTRTQSAITFEIQSLNTKSATYMETIKDIQTTLQYLKDQEVRINTLFSEKVLQEHLRTIEARILKVSEDLRIHTQSAITSEIQSLNTKSATYIETVKDVQTTLQYLKDQEVRIDTLFSEKVLQDRLRIIEAGVLKISEDWRTRTQSAITAEIQSLNAKSATYMETVKDVQTTLQLLKDQEVRIHTQLALVSSLQPVSNTLSRISSVQRQQQTHSNVVYTSLTKCFYTAVFGEPGQQLDTLGLMKPPPGWDAVCFTNQPNLQANGWRLIRMPIEQGSSILQSKFVKWNSHTLLEEYDVAVWLDAYLAPNRSSVGLLEQWILQAYAEKAAIVHRKHDVRNCVWDECKAVVDGKRDTPEHVESLKRRLVASNMPKNFGLFDTNMMIRFHKLKICQQISDAVWSALKIDTHRDQLIVTPVYFTSGFKSYKVLPLQQAFDRSGTHVRISTV